MCGAKPWEKQRESEGMERPGGIGVLFVRFGLKIDGPGLPGGLIIYQGNSIYLPQKDTYTWSRSVFLTAWVRQTFHPLVPNWSKHNPNQQPDEVAATYDLVAVGQLAKSISQLAYKKTTRPQLKPEQEGFRVSACSSLLVLESRLCFHRLLLCVIDMSHSRRGHSGG